jgi:hypothetical protein
MLPEMADDEERFKQSCTNAAGYPKNIIYHNSYDHVLTTYAEQLNEQESRLFCDELKAAVYIRDYNEAKKGVQDYLAAQDVLKAVQLKPNKLTHSIRVFLYKVFASVAAALSRPKCVGSHRSTMQIYVGFLPSPISK